MKRFNLYLLLISVLLVACSASSETAKPTREFAGATLPEPQEVPDFTLTAVNDTPVSLSDYRGQYVFLYFGYTFCPDACPITLSQLAEVQERLGENADRMQVIMVSVDPERDTPEKLANYVNVFNESFVGVTGSHEQIQKAGQPYGIYYNKDQETGLVDHTTRAYLINPQGEAIVAYPHDARYAAILADLQWLIEQEES